MKKRCKVCGKWFKQNSHCQKFCRYECRYVWWEEWRIYHSKRLNKLSRLYCKNNKERCNKLQRKRDRKKRIERYIKFLKECDEVMKNPRKELKKIKTNNNLGEPLNQVLCSVCFNMIGREYAKKTGKGWICQICSKKS